MGQDSGAALSTRPPSHTTSWKRVAQIRLGQAGLRQTGNRKADAKRCEQQSTQSRLMHDRGVF